MGTILPGITAIIGGEQVEKARIRIKDFQFAEKNGIGIERVKQRVWVLGWSVEKAITFPVGASYVTGWHEWKEVAKENGVEYSTYRNRIENGWEAERAATTPPAKRKFQPNPIWQKWKELAERHGVYRATFQYRTNKLGWSHERAATTPPLKWNTGV